MTIMPPLNNPRDASAAMDLLGLRLAEGVPHAAIARELLAGGYTSRSGNAWTVALVIHYADRIFRQHSRPDRPAGIDDNSAAEAP